MVNCLKHSYKVLSIMANLLIITSLILFGIKSLPISLYKFSKSWEEGGLSESPEGLCQIT